MHLLHGVPGRRHKSPAATLTILLTCSVESFCHGCECLCTAIALELPGHLFGAAGRVHSESSCFGRGEKTPTPKTRFSIWTLLSQKTFRYLWRFYSLLFVAFSWLFRGPLLSIKQCSGLFRYFFVALFRGPRFGQILRVLALEQSSD